MFILEWLSVPCKFELLNDWNYLVLPFEYWTSILIVRSCYYNIILLEINTAIIEYVGTIWGA